MLRKAKLVRTGLCLAFAVALSLAGGVVAGAWYARASWFSGVFASNYVQSARARSDVLGSPSNPFARPVFLEDAMAGTVVCPKVGVYVTVAARPSGRRWLAPFLHATPRSLFFDIGEAPAASAGFGSPAARATRWNPLQESSCFFFLSHASSPLRRISALAISQADVGA